jgi:hypothetical protein
MLKRSLLLAVPVLLVAAGCASGDDDAAADAAAEASTESAESSDETTGADTGTSTDEPGDESSGDTGATGDGSADDDPELSGDANSAWCQASQRVDDISLRLDGSDFVSATPEQLEELFTDMTDAIGDARDVAPPELEDAVQTTFDGFTRLRDALADADWSFLDVDLTVIEDIDGEMDAAGDQISAYNEQVCGIPADDDGIDPGTAEATGDTGEGFDPADGTVREQIVTSLVELGFEVEEASCIVENLDVSAYVGSSDTALIIEAFDACGIDISRLAEIGG